MEMETKLTYLGHMIDKTTTDTDIQTLMNKKIENTKPTPKACSHIVVNLTELMRLSYK